MVGFEPTDPGRDQRISSAPRYDHFDTSPCIKSSYNRILLNAIRSVNRSDMERFWSDILSERCRNNLAKCLYYCILFFEPKLDNHISSAPRYDHFDTSPNAPYCNRLTLNIQLKALCNNVKVRQTLCFYAILPWHPHRRDNLREQGRNQLMCPLPGW